MSNVLDNILKNRKGGQSFYPTSDQDLEAEATNLPDIPETRASDQDNKQPAEVIQTQQDVTPPPANKWGYSQSELDTLEKAGYTPDKLERYLSDFDPAKGDNFLSRIYESSMPKPTAPDEKALKRNRIIAGVADGLSMLSQMYSAGKGAHMRERDFNQSAIAGQASQERNLRNIYLQQANRYNDGLVNARTKDFLQALEDYRNGQKGIQGVVAAKQKADEAARQFQEKQRFAYDKLAQDQANKDKDFDIKKDRLGLDGDRLKETSRHNKAMEGLGWARIADARNRTSAYIKNINLGGNKKSYEILLKANPNDPNAEDFNGESVVRMPLTDAQVKDFAIMAKSNPEFMKKHDKDLVLQRPDMLGSGSTKYADDRMIAATYLKELYENSFTPSPAIPSTATTPITNWGQYQNWMPSFNMGDEDTAPEEDESGDDGWAWID